MAYWNEPGNFLQAMQSGANLGLNIRSQNQAQQEAVNRLQMQRDDMLLRAMQAAEEEKRQRQAAAQQMALANAQMQQRNLFEQAQNELANKKMMLEDEYRKGQIGTDQLNAGLRDAELKLRANIFNNPTPKIVNTAQGTYSIDPKTGVAKEVVKREERPPIVTTKRFDPLGNETTIRGTQKQVEETARQLGSPTAPSTGTNKPVLNIPNEMPQPKQYKSKAEVKKDLSDGKLSVDEAYKIIKDLGLQ